MSLTIWKNRDPMNGGLARLRDEMDRTFEKVFNEPFGFAEPKLLRYEGWVPPLDMSETDTEVTLRAEVPGIAAKDLDISVTGKTLSIAGEKEEINEKEKEDFYQCERRFGAFKRVIDLPETVDPDKVTAEVDNGLVTIHVAKRPNAKPKQVEVKPVGRKVLVNS